MPLFRKRRRQHQIPVDFVPPIIPAGMLHPLPRATPVELSAPELAHPVEGRAGQTSERVALERPWQRPTGGGGSEPVHVTSPHPKPRVR